MKLILLALFLMTSQCSITPEIIGFVHGYAVGSGLSSQMPSLFDCAQDVDLAVPVAQIILREFQRASSLEAIVSAVQDLARSLNEFTQTCGDLAVEVKNVSNEVSRVAHRPDLRSTIEKNLYDNAEHVGRAFAEISLALLNEDGYSAGVEAGNLVLLLID